MNNSIIIPFLGLFLNISMGCTFWLLRGSLGFGEEALQSLPGNIGSQVQCHCFFFPCLKIILEKCQNLSWIMYPSVQTYKQDVNDVLTALDLVIRRGLIDPSKVAVVGGSHGGFLTTHLIGQVLGLPLFFCILQLRSYYCV